MSRRPLILLGLVVVLGLGMWCTPRVREVLRLYFPPERLYEPIVSIPLDLEDGERRTFELRHPYRGSYALKVQFDGPGSSELRVENSLDIDTSLALAVRCWTEHGTAWEEAASGPFSPFWGQGVWGLWVFTYRVPEDLPRRRPVSCDLTILEGDSRLTAAFGEAKMAICYATTL
jgi:hypothetical protein